MIKNTGCTRPNFERKSIVHCINIYFCALEHDFCGVFAILYILHCGRAYVMIGQTIPRVCIAYRLRWIFGKRFRGFRGNRFGGDLYHAIAAWTGYDLAQKL